MRVLAISVMAFGALGLIACTPPAAKKDEAPVADASTCPDDGPRFPVSGKCIGRVANYMNLPADMSGLPDGCSWVPTEVAMPGDEALIFMSAKCGDKVTTYEFAGGARSAALTRTASGIFDTIPADDQPVKIFTLSGGESGKDQKTVLLDMARESTKDKKEAAACEVRSLDPAKPDDRWVVDVNEAARKANPKKYSEAYSACGPYGITDAQNFWLIKQGYGFFFDLGQDMPDILPESFTLFRKGEGAEYVPVE